MTPIVKRPLLVIAAVASVLALAGCGGGSGGGASCEDVCGRLFACADTLGVSGSQVADAFGNSSYDNYADCVSHCSTGDCPRQQALLDCANRVQCDTFDQVVADTTSCFVTTGCDP